MKTINTSNRISTKLDNINKKRIALMHIATNLEETFKNSDQELRLRNNRELQGKPSGIHYKGETFIITPEIAKDPIVNFFIEDMEFNSKKYDIDVSMKNLQLKDVVSKLSILFSIENNNSAVNHVLLGLQNRTLSEHEYTSVLEIISNSEVDVDLAMSGFIQDVHSDECYDFGTVFPLMEALIEKGILQSEYEKINAIPFNLCWSAYSAGLSAGWLSGSVSESMFNNFVRSVYFEKFNGINMAYMVGYDEISSAHSLSDAIKNISQFYKESSQKNEFKKIFTIQDIDQSKGKNLKTVIEILVDESEEINWETFNIAPYYLFYRSISANVGVEWLHDVSFLGTDLQKTFDEYTMGIVLQSFNGKRSKENLTPVQKEFDILERQFLGFEITIYDHWDEDY